MAATSMSCQSSLPAAHGWCTCTMVGVQPLQRSLPLLPPPPLRPLALLLVAAAAANRPPASAEQVHGHELEAVRPLRAVNAAVAAPNKK